MNRADGNAGLYHIPQLVSRSARGDVELNSFADYQLPLLAVSNLASRAAMCRYLPVKAYPCAGQARCKWLVKSNATRWSSGMKTLGQVRCNFPGGLPSVECDRACRLSVTGIRSFRTGGDHLDRARPRS